MLLNELARASGTSTASIKYYRRQRLLPPGRRLTTTRFDYGREHLERLALIRALRELAHAPIEDIRALTTVIDEGRPLVKALEIAQAIATGLLARLHEEPPPEDEDPRVAALIGAMGWADVGSGPRVALDRLLGAMGAEDVAADLPTLLRYARPLEEIAREDLAGIRSEPQCARCASSGPSASASSSPSTDAIVRHALIGSLAFTQLTVVLRALAHASVSLEVGAEEGQTGPHGAHP
ncbi:MerR family transcriptional regulator [Brachybacterium sp. MASK1Z-5]|uniref:MerR family transcriptional regulator n=1 Tax=Brachybacterium halotolerans TaxID=2795215 RepID=A0ABS1BAJ2_9MICO|nr:MerR family transcriptional regulator [Brachybacterium halotolerans]MBK0331681.1 MerR family transcriptional regulator [Brachybacterium halotolerans]